MLCLKSIVPLALLSFAAGCASPVAPTIPALSPVASAADATQATIIVRVLRYDDQSSPIGGAAIDVNGHQTAVTDSTGMAAITVACGPLDIAVSRQGYSGFSAAGTVSGSETWTFYLQER